MKNRGITLVALVVTIVVLIILATISINIIFGEEGILEKAKQAKQDMANAQEEEKQILADAANSMDQHIVGERETVTVDKEQYEQLLKDVENLKSNAQEHYYQETITNKTITSNVGSGINVKTYEIPEDGVYMISIYSYWVNLNSTQTAKFNIINQVRNSSLVKQVIDGGSAYCAGSGQHITTTTVFNCEKGDTIDILLSQFSGSDKTVNVELNLTRIN